MEPTPAEAAAAYERMMTRTRRAGATLNGKRCLVYTGARCGGGYGNIRVGARVLGAHRIAFLHRHGWLPPTVMHACDNPPCLEDAHHVAGTQALNLADMRQRGRARYSPRRGETNHLAKLTPAQVRRIRALCADGQVQRRVAARYGITQRAVSLIVNRQRWAHVA